jgi:hypothetical protein
MRHWRVLFVGGMLSLAGCTGMTASECELADWEAVGYEDGSVGRSSDVFARHRKGCAKHDVAPDFRAYRTGRDSGLREYCQPARGYRIGASGGEYLGVCPADLEDAFLDSYDEGRELYELEYAVKSTNRKLEHKKQRVRDIEVELTELLARSLADETTGDERATLVVQTKQLTEERIGLGRDIGRLEHELRDREADLADYRAQRISRL